MRRILKPEIIILVGSTALEATSSRCLSSSPPVPRQSAGASLSQEQGRLVASGQGQNLKIAGRVDGLGKAAVAPKPLADIWMVRCEV